VVVAAEESAHYQVVYYSIMGDARFGEDTRWVANTDEVNEVVESTWNAIGITRAYMEPDSVRMLSIEGVECNGETLMRGWYPLLWPVILVTDGEPGEEERAFLDWVRAPDGYHAIWEAGFIPLWEHQPDFAAEEVNLVVKTSSMLFAQTEELSHLFRQSHPGWAFDIEQTGTPAGIQAVMDEAADIAMAVGYLTEEEWAQYPEALDFHVGWVPAFFISRTDLGVEGLSADDFRRIVAGDIRNWSEVGGPDREIVIGAYAESNAFLVVAYYLLQDWAPYDGIFWLESVEQVVEFVGKNQHALGIIDMTETPENIRWMPINGVEISGESLMNGEYYLMWPVLLVTKGEPDEFERQFIDFLYGEEGKQALWENRLAPMP
jgi:phosphate transport system substrate-binding protein